HPVQEAFVENAAVQCGYCTPGMVLKSVGLLKKNPNPSEGEIREWMEGNICRCTGYEKIVTAVQLAGKKIAQADS
ncbi:MAG: (2Fe-2S)-binding protein, partial [Candidatus Thiodiazotropha sp. (ex Lucinoma kastoroae)]|nr:(2Fe-2S)-binding protein [Candidatus Thiodiazotropha sp. (ex Lucinoma kastoroae)]